jgi:hypothetical protein
MTADDVMSITAVSACVMAFAACAVAHYLSTSV